MYFELLNAVCKELSTTVEREELLRRILFAFSRFLGLNRGTISILDPMTETAHIAASVGLSSVERARGLYKLGEGITGHVLKSGEPIVIPQVASDPRFLNKTGSRKKTQELSFLCVPIQRDGKTIGTLSVDRNYELKHDLATDLQALTITTNIIAYILRMHDLREVERSRLLEENKHLRSELREKFAFSGIIANSFKMHEVLEFVSQVSGSNTTVLLRGESGTGKEMIAHAIHYNSSRADKPFVKVNCSAIPDSLIESELFGHERGAFTGALASKPGKFELAQEGSIFLDEIGDLTAAAQVKLLRVLQSREVERLGSTQTKSLNVRVIAATNRNLEKDMTEGKFREDLYYRLNVFPIYLPPLRERKTDILLLADHFLEKYSKVNKKKIKRITTPAINMLMSYHWPGNVRELENCIERSVLVCRTESVSGNDLPPTLQMASPEIEAKHTRLPHAVQNLEQEMIIDALKRNRGVQRQAASDLGISERILGYKIKKYGLSPQVYTNQQAG